MSAARDTLGLPSDYKVVAVAGGSLGARRINDAAVDLARMWKARDRFALWHVAGERDLERVRQRAGETAHREGENADDPAGGLIYRIVGFEDRMDLVLSAADIVVQRAGASTVSELSAIGVPSILVPLPGAPGDHQTANAVRMVEAGAAVMIPDGELDAERLGPEIDALLGDPARLEAMARAARSMASPKAADLVAALAEEHARG